MWKMYLFPWMYMAGRCKTTGEASGIFFLFIRQMFCYFKSETIKNTIVMNEHLKNCTSKEFIHSRVSFLIRCSYKETEHL